MTAHAGRRTAPRRRGPRVVRRALATATHSFEISDSSTLRVPAASLLRGAAPRDPAPQSARLADQFIERNRGLLANLDASIDQHYNGFGVDLVICTNTTIGAVPLVSPTTGRPDYGLVVKPRFAWPGIGPMLADMGWRIVPAPLSLPLLPRSDRKIPPWLLSTIVLARVEAMLNQLQRRFEMIDETRSSPRGSIDWPGYATRYASRARLLDVPCRFPDLRADRDLRAAIRFTLNKQLQSLATQRTAGVFVLKLIELCQSLADRVRDVAPRPPGPRDLDTWLRGPLKTSVFRNGLQAIEWTAEDRGLAGLSDLQGLPWSMSMEAFFEAWVETVLVKAASHIGGVVRTGRQRQTVAALRWEPPYLGSQKSLIPDLVLERGDLTVIVDAKYKEHWEEMQERRWGQLEDELRERHRADLLQVLAYANTASSPRIVVVLVYPCRPETWTSLRARNRLFHKTSLTAGQRRIELMLTAMPIGASVAGVAQDFAEQIV